MKIYLKIVLPAALTISTAIYCMQQGLDWRKRRDVQLKARLPIGLVIFRGWVNKRNVPEAQWVKARIDEIKDPQEYEIELQRYNNLHNRGELSALVHSAPLLEQ